MPRSGWFRGPRPSAIRRLVTGFVPAVVLLASAGCSSTPGPPPSQLALTPSTLTVGGWTLRTVALTRGVQTVPLLAVSCASTTVCVAVGGTTTSYVAVTTDGGAKWKAGAVQPDVGQPDDGLTSVACPTVSTCLATGATGATQNSAADVATPTVALTISGSTSRVTTLPGPVMQQVACPNSTRCLGLTASAAGSGVGLEATTDLGETWQPVAGAPLLSAAQTSITCSAAGVCSLAGQASTHGGEVLLLSTDAGRSWWSVTLPSASSPIAVSCTSATSCVEVDERGGTGWTTSDGGRSWLADSVDPNGGILNSVICNDEGGCLAVGADAAIGGSGQSSVTTGMASVSADEGISWRASTPFQNSVPQAASCPDVRQCVVVFGEIA